jgi:hypothetical protein
MQSSAHRLRAVLVSIGVLLPAVAALSLGSAEAVPAAPNDAAPSSNDAAPAQKTPQPARWAQRKISFTYSGFTTHYSCEGLVDKVRVVLLQLGARRSDMNVHEAGCTSRLGEPTPFPAVAGTFSVLEPVAPTQAFSPNGAGGIVFAHWQPVNVRFDRSQLDMAGQCELLEQVKQHIVPLFPARNVDFSSNCVPHQLTPGGTALQVEVLMLDKGNTSSTRNDSGPAARTSEPVLAAN